MKHRLLALAVPFSLAAKLFPAAHTDKNLPGYTPVGSNCDECGFDQSGWHGQAPCLE